MDKVIVEFKKEIHNCSECPFTVEIYEQGYCATDCQLCGAYSTIPKEGIRKDCPFRKEDIIDETK